jgi:hypothetical protein
MKRKRVPQTCDETMTATHLLALRAGIETASSASVYFTTPMESLDDGNAVLGACRHSLVLCSGCS